MNRDDLEQLVSQGESQRLEFKKSTGDLKGGLESLCGMLNADGGQVLFGVTPSGKICGQQVSDSTLQEVANALRQLEPPAHVAISRIALPNQDQVLLLDAANQRDAPYTFRGRAYRRIETTTSVMPQREYQRRLLKRGNSHQRWENQPATGYTLRDLNTEEIRRTIREAVDAGRLDADVTGPAEALRKLHLVEGKTPVQAAVVAFAKDVLPDYPQCGLRMARFRGTTKTDFLDQRQLTGNAFELLQEANLFLRRHLPVSGRFEPGVMERLDEPLFPTLALREALVNALCHRDYSIVGGAINIAIFDDRLEIASTGCLPFGITVDQLKHEHSSKPRNPLLAEVFYRRGLIERWGRGTQKIVELCLQAGHPEPVFEERAGELVVRFIPSGYIPPHKVSHDLTERQRRILHILADGNKWRARDILSQFDPPPARSTLGDELDLLRTFGMVGSSGRGPGARWFLLEPK